MNELEELREQVVSEPTARFQQEEALDIMSRRFQLLQEAGQELGEITDLIQISRACNIVINQLAKAYSSSQLVIRRYDGNAQELVLIRAVHRFTSLPLIA
jgi:hypothetical protein